MVSDNALLAKLIASVMFVALFFLYLKRYFWDANTHPALEQLGMSIIIGAAAGNLLERFLTGRVTDYLEFAFMYFPVFNFADVLIDLGVILILLSMKFSAKK